jgi:hypothetical protein
MTMVTAAKVNGLQRTGTRNPNSAYGRKPNEKLSIKQVMGRNLNAEIQKVFAEKWKFLPF